MTSHTSNDENNWTDATVVDVKRFGSVKWLRLHVPAEKRDSLSFKAGQWVDFKIPGVTPFTGYSMVSTPSLLTSSGALDLAVKYSDYPPTLWVHEKCQIGDVVKVRVGGTFFYSSPAPSSDSPQGDDVLLLAGGVGINPLFSILQNFLEQASGASIALLYSAKGLEDLIFKKEIDQLAKDNPQLTVRMFCTGEKASEKESETEQNSIRSGRISKADVVDAVQSLNKPRLQVFICGPPAFIDDMAQHCETEGVDKARIHFEKWW